MADFSFAEFFRNVRERGERAIAAARRGLDEAGEQLLGDAQQLAPLGGGSHSPHDPAPGTLQGSGTAEPAELVDGQLVKVIGFNTEYAAVQHEDLDFGHDQGQAKYLETAMRNGQDKMMEHIAGRVKEQWGG